MNGKTKIVLDYILGEGLTLVNNRKVLTYICHSGRSAIDLSFVRGFSIVEHGLLTSNEAALIRKHIPVSLTLKATTHTRSPIKAQKDTKAIKPATTSGQYRQDTTPATSNQRGKVGGGHGANNRIH